MPKPETVDQLMARLATQSDNTAAGVISELKAREAVATAG